MQKLARITHGGKTHTIALFDDLQVEELNVLLTTVFNIEGKILGFLDQVSALHVFYESYKLAKRIHLGFHINQYLSRPPGLRMSSCLKT